MHVIYEYCNQFQVKLNDIRRCVLLNYDAETKTIEFRHLLVSLFIFYLCYHSPHHSLFHPFTLPQIHPFITPITLLFTPLMLHHLLSTPIHFTPPSLVHPHVNSTSPLPSNVRSVPVGMSRAMKKIVKGIIPDMSSYADISDYLTKYVL